MWAIAYHGQPKTIDPQFKPRPSYIPTPLWQITAISSAAVLKTMEKRPGTGHLKHFFLFSRLLVNEFKHFEISKWKIILKWFTTTTTTEWKICNQHYFWQKLISLKRPFPWKIFLSYRISLFRNFVACEFFWRKQNWSYPNFKKS